ncbi:hypothetical protein SAMN05660862_3328 [Sphingobacterium psychroaquaticum]|uniref:Uncharacterized protein n=1 Tax=Sphingobacterium psychroaquaticum TaxID=561061 RepID=A0A1X7KYI5_9SPHI|nr:hypothetical protein SAMN05660862_3328 [Sphingobacterium psychroaquaticum]
MPQKTNINNSNTAIKVFNIQKKAIKYSLLSTAVLFSPIFYLFYSKALFSKIQSRRFVMLA